MTKNQHVRELYAGGEQTRRGLVKLTGYSRDYVSNILTDIRHPGAARANAKRWRKKNYDCYRRHQKKKPSCKKGRARNVLRHQTETRAHAGRHGRTWTDQELAYLTEHGRTMSIRQLALALGRTYSAVKWAGCEFRIDLGFKEKTGVNAQQFRVT